MFGVFLRKDGLVGGDSPVDAEAGVKDADAAIGLRMRSEEHTSELQSR